MPVILILNFAILILSFIAAGMLLHIIWLTGEHLDRTFKLIFGGFGFFVVYCAIRLINGEIKIFPPVSESIFLILFLLFFAGGLVNLIFLLHGLKRKKEKD